VNITETEAAQRVGADVIRRLKELTLALYAQGAEHARRCGIIVADTKFEFGVADDGRLILIDEILTPDSSRFWPLAQYRAGGPQASFDKQFVRDYLESIRWNKRPPVPTLPDEVVSRTRDKYLEAYRRLTGFKLETAHA
jgi:phosphoribosylaminoimidazole-succinocarboxamide synthase